jgi:hypothetical protein
VLSVSTVDVVIGSRLVPEVVIPQTAQSQSLVRPEIPLPA